MPTRSGQSSGCSGVGMHVGFGQPKTSRSLTRGPVALNMRQAEEPQSVEKSWEAQTRWLGLGLALTLTLTLTLILTLTLTLKIPCG